MGGTLVVGVLVLLASRRLGKPEVMLAVVVGLCFGAGSVLTKALTVVSTAPGQSVMTLSLLLNPLLIAVVLANVAGLVLLQAAFQRGRAAVIVPLQLALANAVTVLAGVVVFAEHITLLRGSGILLIVVGTTLLQLKPSSDQAHPAG
jgi:drug/metabolite transporter (DMT)-like permease